MGTIACIGAERYIVAAPIDPGNGYGVDGMESGVHIGVGHHPYRKLDIGGVVLVVACPEGELQGAEGVDSSVDGGKNSVLVIFVVPTQDLRAGMTVGIGHHAGVHTRVPTPAGDCGRLGIACIGVEVFDVGQRVQRGAESAESHHRRPVGSEASAFGTHIHIVLRIGRQTCEQQAVGAHIGDNGGGVGHKAFRAVRHIVIDCPHGVHPAYQCRSVGLPVHGCGGQCLAGHKVAHLDVVNEHIRVQRVGGNDGQTTRRPGVTVGPNRYRNPTRVA